MENRKINCLFIEQNSINPVKLNTLIRFDKRELEECIKGKPLKNRRSHGR